MKRKWKVMALIVSVVLLFGTVCNTVYAEDKIVAEINEETFPDAEFRNHILTGSHYVWDEDNNMIEIVYDANKDGKLSESEVANVKQHLVSEMPIYDLTGIEYFTSIIELNCQWTQISELDLSKNTELLILNCYRANLQGTLDLSKNTKLIGVSCGRNKELAGIDVSGCKELDSLDFVNSSVGSVDLSNNTKLRSLSCADAPISELDLSNNSELIQLTCYNTKLTEVDLSNNLKMELLDCSVNDIKEIDLSNNLELVSVNLGETLVKGIDLSKHDKLKDLIISESFVWLNIGNNKNLSVNMRDGKADITVEAGGFDITKMFPGIDADKITIVSGASIDGNVVSGYEEGTPIVYTYDCGTAQSGDVVLNVTLNLDVIEADKNIQPAIDAYDEMKEVLTNQVGDVDALEAAVDKMTTTNEKVGIEHEDFKALQAHDSDYWKVMLQANAIVRMSDVLDAYAQNKNASTALEVVSLYEQLEPDYGQLLAGWFPDIASIYDDAKQNVPSQEVIDVYEAYVNVKNAMEFGYDADFVKACEEFGALMDIYNALSEDGMNDLAALVGVGSGDEAYNTVLSDWIKANMILELGELYDAYGLNPDTETAKALVEKYEAVFGATEMFSPEDFELFRNAVAGIDSAYEEAKLLLEDASVEGDSDKDEADKDVSPKTGDASDMLMTIVVMMAVACVIVATTKRKA